MEIDHEKHRKLESSLEGMRQERHPWWTHWRKLADYYLPRRYVWLLSDNERRKVESFNPHILDGTGTQAARVLASGMMNGITSPSRPWFRTRLSSGLDDELDEARVWLDEVERRMLHIMAESNFYNALAVMYLDLSVFGTAAMSIYEDFDNVIHCTNHALGEYYLAQDAQHRVNMFGREFQYTYRQMIDEFGEENVSDRIREANNQGGQAMHNTVIVRHLIEPHNDKSVDLADHFAYREIFWEKSQQKGTVLAVRGYREFPLLAPRWELSGNDVYGSSPGMDALGDVVQLQHETKRKGQALDFMVRPPMVADIQLKHSPTALIPGGMTYVAGQNSNGMQPAYQVNPPMQHLTLDIRDVQARIREIFHNDLFQMISQLETVRSATEIDARREEKLVLLGPVLERFENEALDPSISRIFNVMARSGLLPPAPPEMEGEDIEIQYVSILNAAQSALSAAPTERLLQVLANVGSVEPTAYHNIDFDTLIREYGKDVGAKAKIFNSEEEVQRRREQERQRAAVQEAAQAGGALAEGAKTLSETDVGGGANALQRLIGQ